MRGNREDARLGEKDVSRGQVMNSLVHYGNEFVSSKWQLGIFSWGKLFLKMNTLMVYNLVFIRR